MSLPGDNQPAQQRVRYPFRYAVFDKLEGKITGQVWAADDDEAEEEASIAASERGCSFVEEIEVYKLVDA